MTRRLLAVTAAAVALFLWGFAFWAPASSKVFSTPNDADGLREAVRRHLPDAGVYYVPDPTSEDRALTDRLMREGPIAMIFVRRAGMPLADPAGFVAGFLHMWVMCLLLTFLLDHQPADSSRWRRAGIMALAGLAASWWSDLGSPIWWRHPWAFHLVTLAYDLGAWTIAGLVLARLATPPATAR